MKSSPLLTLSLAGHGAVLVAAKTRTPPQGAGAAPPVPPPFDAQSQYVSTAGKYAWVAPSATDARGPCPGLNAMANHGYIPHSGIATIDEFQQACTEVFGMGSDLAALIAVYGAIFDGDGTTWSIGGEAHTGISASHSNYESDNSPLKGDLYQYGDLQKLIIPQYKELFNMQPDASTANYNLEVMRDFRVSRFHQSISMNPLFSYGPFAGQIVANAAHAFIYRLMSNKSAEYPEGILNQDNLKSFMAISGTDEDPIWTFGWERIPDNWFKRNGADMYTIPYLVEDIAYFVEKQPEVGGVGCNDGKVNTYNSISISNLTNGAYTSQQAIANPVCFGLEFTLADAFLATGYTAAQLAPLINILKTATSALDCQPISKVDTAVLSGCAGLTSYGGPTAKIAKGAIQAM